jgi:subtilase family serine protease
MRPSHTRRFLIALFAAFVAGPAAALLLSSVTNATAAGSKATVASALTAASTHRSAAQTADFTTLGRATSALGRIRIGAAPLAPLHSSVLGALSVGTRLPVVVALAPRDAVALSRYATAVSTPGSPDFHHYLTVPEFRAQFGATTQSIAAVRSLLSRDGLSLGATSANGLSVDVTGTAGALEQAFSTSLDRLKLPGGRVAYSNTSAPMLPESVGTKVEAIVGLSSVFLPHRQLLVPKPKLSAPSATRLAPRATSSDGAVTSCAGATANETTSTTAVNPPLTSNAYTTQDIAQAYDYEPLYGAGDEGAGVTVGIYELEPNIAADISAFESCYGISTSVKYVPVDGGATGTASSTNGDGEETELDIDNVIGLAPKVNVEVYQAPNTDAGALDQYTQMIAPPKGSTTPKLNVISTSWGECETEQGSAAATAENTVFQEAATEGISVAAASGDSGAQDCQITELGPIGEELPLTDPTMAAVDDPASQPFVTGAGGTTLNTLGSSPTTRPGEVVWNNGTPLALAQQGGAGGGGDSDLWLMPSYQTGAAKSLNVINSESSAGVNCGGTQSTDCREVPDVSANADAYTSYIIYYNGAWTEVGGTSGAAPLWASLFAEADGSAGCQSTGDVGFANPVLYGLASSSPTAYAADFNDITSGNNDLYSLNGGAFAAGAGYDQASGLGTPVAGNLAPALCSEAAQVASPATPAGSSTPGSTPATTPAASPTTVTTPGKTVTVSQSSTTNTVKTSCKIPAKLSFVQHPAYPVREIKAVLYINGKLTKTVKGKRIVDVVINRPKATKFTLKLVTTLSSAEVVSHQLTYNGCKSSKPTIRVLHKPVGGVRR